MSGDYENGWNGYDWRWRVEESVSSYRELDKPLWQGEPIDGKKLLVWPEQGVGDEIFCAGMMAGLLERGAEIILLSDDRLAPLFSRSFPTITCLGQNDPAVEALEREIDVHIPIAGLGRLFHQQRENISRPRALPCRRCTAERLVSQTLPEAAAIYQNILKTNSDHPAALHLLGVIAHQTGNNDEAVVLITQALTENPNLTEAHNNLGLALFALDQFEDAIASYGKALALNQDYAIAHNNLANALMETGQLDAAIGSFQKTLALRPEDAEVHNNLGNVLRQRERPQDAADSFRKAIAINPGNSGLHNNLGNALKDQQRLEEAVASYLKAISLDA